MWSFRLIFDIEKKEFDSIIRHYQENKTINNFNKFISLINIIKKGMLASNIKPNKNSLKIYLKNNNAEYLLPYADLIWSKWNKKTIQVFFN